MKKIVIFSLLAVVFLTSCMTGTGGPYDPYGKQRPYSSQRRTPIRISSYNNPFGSCYKTKSSTQRFKIKNGSRSVTRYERIPCRGSEIAGWLDLLNQISW